MKNKNKVIMIGLSSLILCLIAVVIVLVVTMVNMNNTLNKLSDRVGLDNIPISEINKIGGNQLSGKELSTALEVIGTNLEEIRTKNIYLPCYETETDYATLLYNSKGECVTQSTDNSISVYKSDKQTTTFGDNIYYGTDVDALTNLELAYKIATQGKAIVTSLDVTTDKAAADNIKVTEYLIDVQGYDNIEAMYDLMEDGLGSEMALMFKANLEKSELEDDTSILNFRYAYIIQDGTLIDFGCYMYFGEGYEDNWSNCYSSWFTDGYAEVGEWSLQDEWYSYDYSKMTEDKGEYLQSLLTDLYTDINIMLADYGGEVDSDPDTSGVPELDTIDPNESTNPEVDNSDKPEQGGEDTEGNPTDTDTN